MENFFLLYAYRNIYIFKYLVLFTLYFTFSKYKKKKKKKKYNKIK